MAALNWNAPWGFVFIIVLLLCVGIFFFAQYVEIEDRRGKYTIITGLSGSGKSALFFKLVEGEVVSTFTSLKENLAAFKFPGSTNEDATVHLIDVPGHSRLRGSALEKWARNGRGVVFVIDSATFIQQTKDVAACLYQTLAERPIRRGNVPVYVLCNKQDLVTATPPLSIKGALEREFETLRKTMAAESHLGGGGVCPMHARSIHLSFLAETSIVENCACTLLGLIIANLQMEYLGTKGQPFAFEQLTSRVTFEGGALENVEAVRSWIQSNANEDAYNPLPQWLKGLVE